MKCREVSYIASLQRPVAYLSTVCLCLVQGGLQFLHLGGGVTASPTYISKSTNQSKEQSINQTIHQTGHRSINQSINQTINKLEHSFFRPSAHSIHYQPKEKSTNLSNKKLSKTLSLTVLAQSINQSIKDRSTN
jgi:hypothetical protein